MAFCKKFLINCADLCIKYTQYDDRGIAQLVEHRSPKPRVVSSNLTAPATQDKVAEKRLFSLYIKHLSESVRGCIDKHIFGWLHGLLF